MMTLIIVWCALFLIGLTKNGIKAFQQDNINRRLYHLITPTSFGLSACDVLWFGGLLETWQSGGIVGVIVGWMCLAIGSGQGTKLSMRLHDRMRG